LIINGRTLKWRARLVGVFKNEQIHIQLLVAQHTVLCIVATILVHTHQLAVKVGIKTFVDKTKREVSHASITENLTKQVLFSED